MSIGVLAISNRVFETGKTKTMIIKKLTIDKNNKMRESCCVRLQGQLLNKLYSMFQINLRGPYVFIALCPSSIFGSYCRGDRGWMGQKKGYHKFHYFKNTLNQIIISLFEKLFESNYLYAS